MSIPVFDSASTKAVRQALKVAYPGTTLSVEEKPENGTRTVCIIGFDFALEGDAITRLCVDVYARARALSRIPVSVSVQGMGGAGRLLDAEVESLAETIAAKFGVTAIVVSA